MNRFSQTRAQQMEATMKTSSGGSSAISSFVMLLVALALAATPQLSRAQNFCIPPHLGLPHHGSQPPTVDGYVGFVSGAPNIPGDPIEQGWVKSGLISYAYGGTGAWMELRAVRHNSQPSVYFSFVVQSDQAFDADDGIVLVFDPGWTSGATAFSSSARRLDILPVSTAGAQGAAGTGTQLVRTNRAPVGVNWRKFDTTAGQWVDVVPPGTQGTHWDIKVRSWEAPPPATSEKSWSVELKLPTTNPAGADWVSLGSAFGFYTNVVKICGEAECEQDQAPVLTYFSNQFTWPRTDYAATPGSPGFRAITGDFLTMRDAFDSIPVRYLGRGTTASTCSGVRFVGGNSGIGVRPSSGTTLGNQIDASPGATNTLVARLSNDGAAADGRGIDAEFRIANWGVGGGFGTWDKIPARPTGNLPAGPLNQMQPNQNASVRVDVPVTSSSEIWMQTQLSAADGYCDPDVTASCPPGSKDAHSCIWVLLSSNQNANIWESSVRRNFDITNLSVKSKRAEISGKGWGPGAGANGAQVFHMTTRRQLLVRPPRIGVAGPGAPGTSITVAPGTTVAGPAAISALAKDVRLPAGLVPVELAPAHEKLRPIELISPFERELLARPGGGASQPLWTYVWEIDASRATPSTLKIGQKTYRVMEPAGTFGMVGQHTGAVTQFAEQIGAGPGLAQGKSAGTYQAMVPNGGNVKVHTVTAALAPGEKAPAAPKPSEVAQADGKQPDGKPPVKECGCLDLGCRARADAGGAMTVAGLFLVGGIGAGGLAFVRRRKGKPEKAEDGKRQS